MNEFWLDPDTGRLQRSQEGARARRRRELDSQVQEAWALCNAWERRLQGAGIPWEEVYRQRFVDSKEYNEAWKAVILHKDWAKYIEDKR